MTSRPFLSRCCVWLLLFLSFDTAESLLTAFLGGGTGNVASGDYSAVTGGESNVASADYAVVGAGQFNEASDVLALVVGGSGNTAEGLASIVVGGQSNMANVSYATVCGGLSNTVAGSLAFVGGGRSNLAADLYATVGGGILNTARGLNSFVGGGGGLYDTAATDFIDGNLASGNWSTIAAGRGNIVVGTYATIVGGFANTASGYGSFVGGGGAQSKVHGNEGVGGHEASGMWSTVVGGYFNHADGDSSAVGGGHSNFAVGTYSVVGGGKLNLVSAFASTVAGGRGNTASGFYGFVGGGVSNAASGSFASVCGGEHALASGNHSFVAGGMFSTAAGASSAAFGSNASAQHSTSAVFSFSEVQATCSSVGAGSVNFCVDTGLFVNGIAVASEATTDGLLTMINAVKQNVSQHSVAVDNLAADLVDIDGRLVATNDSLAVLSTTVTAVNTLAVDTSETVGALAFVVSNHTNSLHELEEAMAAARVVDSVLHGAINSTGDQVQELNVTLSSAMQQLHSDVVSNSTKFVSQTDMRLVAVENNASRLQSQLQNLDGSIESLLTDVQAVNSSFRHLEAEVDTCLDVCDLTSGVLALQLNGLTETVTSLNDTVHQVQATLHDRDAYTQSLELNVTAQQTQIVAQQGVIAAMDAEVSLLRSTVDTLVSNMSSLTQALTSLMQETSFAPVSETTVDCSSEVTPCTAQDDVTTMTSTAARDAVTSVPGIAEATTPAVAIPTLHSVELAPTNSSTSSLSTTYLVKANASGSRGALLKYVFTLVEAEDTADESAPRQFVPVVDDHFDSEAFVPIPISRDYSVLVEVVPMVSGEARTDMSVSCLLDHPNDALDYDNATDHVLCPVAHRLALPQIGVDELVGSIQNPIDFVTALDILTESSNSTHSINGTTLLFNEFYAWLLSSNNESSSIDQSIMVLSEFLDAAIQASDQTLMDLVLDAISEIGEHLATDAQVTDATLGVFLDVIDEYATHGVITEFDATSQWDVLQVLDDAIDVVCASSGVTTEYNGSQFVLSCGHSVVGTASNETAVIVSSEDGAPIFTFAGDSATTFSVTQWTTDFGGDRGQSSNEALGAVVGVSFAAGYDAGVVEDADEVDEGFQIAIDISSESANGTALRKRVSCQYWEPQSSSWTERGVILRGLSFDGADVAAICVSSHLTLFTVTDGSRVAEVVEKKISTLSTRFSDFGGIDLLDADTELNYLIPVIFGVVTAAFIIVVAIAKAKGRSQAVSHARKLFVQEGRLHREAVIRSIEYEAILRGWMPAGEFFRLVGLDVATGNTFLALVFSWSHEQVVFTQADKAFMLYSAILSTFLVQSFLADINTADGVTSTNSSPDGDADSDFGYTLLQILVGAVLANILIFPIKYFLPFMIENITSFTTSTDMPRSLYRRHMDLLKARLSHAVRAIAAICGKKKKHKAPTRKQTDAAVSPLKRLRTRGAKKARHHKQIENDGKEFVAKLLQLWMQGSNSTTHFVLPKHLSIIHRRLKFLGIAVRLPRTFTFRRQFLDRAEHSSVDDEGAHSKVDKSSSIDGVGKAPRDSGWHFGNVVRRISLHSTTGPSANAGRVKPYIWEDDTRAADRKTVRVVTIFQRNIRLHQQRRRLLRGIEFDAWHHDCQHWRTRLSFITGSFVLVLGFATLMVCLLVSAAFTLSECSTWALEVGRSLLMQLFITDPAFTLGVFGLKIFVQWSLFRANKQRQNVEKANSLSVAPEHRSEHRAAGSALAAQMPPLNISPLRTESQVSAFNDELSPICHQGGRAVATDHSNDEPCISARDQQGLRHADATPHTEVPRHQRKHHPPMGTWVSARFDSDTSDDERGKAVTPTGVELQDYAICT